MFKIGDESNPIAKVENMHDEIHQLKENIVDFNNKSSDIKKKFSKLYNEYKEREDSTMKNLRSDLIGSQAKNKKLIKSTEEMQANINRFDKELSYKNKKIEEIKKDYAFKLAEIQNELKLKTEQLNSKEEQIQENKHELKEQAKKFFKKIKEKELELKNIKKKVLFLYILLFNINILIQFY